MKNLISIFILLFCIKSFSSCFVDFSLDCNPAGNAPWRIHSAFTRLSLLNSKDVQQDKLGCFQFTQLIKTECQISDNLQAIYLDEKTSIKSSNIVTNFWTSMYDQRSRLTVSFQNYFNASSDQDIIRAGTNVALETKEYFTAIKDFLKDGSLNTTISFPMACNWTDYFSVCGVYGRCISTKNSNVGDRFELTKNASQLCNEGDRTVNVLTSLTNIINLANKTGNKSFSFTPAKISNFSAFGSMPLISQVDGNLQGLTVEKYGINLAAPGLCVPTSQAMMALGLKALSPYSKLKNRFDNSSPIQIQSVRSSVLDPKSIAVNKRYRNFAVHVDEIARAGGLISQFPDRYAGYSGFYSGATYSDPSPPVVQNIAGYSLFYDQDYKTYRPTQDLVEKNYQSWIANNEAVSLSLLSSHSQPPKNSSGIVGHSIVANGYSGSNMIVYDPWQVVSHIQFADYQNPNAGKIIEHLAQSRDNHGNTYPTFQSCINGTYPLCHDASMKCAENIGNLISGMGNTNVNTAIGSCSYSGPASKYDYSVTQKNAETACIKGTTCTNGTDIQVADGTYRMMTFAGNSPGYIGTQTSNTRTAAYVRGYIKAPTWPATMTQNEFRVINPEKGIAVSNPSGQTCTAQTMGKISLSGSQYIFVNPIPKVTMNLSNLSSSTPVTVPCRGFKKVLPDGTYATSNTDFFGTFTVTCSNGNLAVANNSCGVLVTPKSCTMPNAIEAYSLPILTYSSTLKFSYYDGYNSCAATVCQSGFTKSGAGCSCTISNGYNYNLTGQVVNNGCIYNQSSCPAGTIYSPYANTQNPVCLDTKQEIISGDFGTSVSAQGKETLTSYLKDRNGRSIDQLPTANTVYGISSDGYLTFLRCSSSNYSVAKDAKGISSCNILPDASKRKAVMTRLSDGTNKDGSCRSGFVKDYENKYCVSTLSSCSYGPQAVGLMTFDPKTQDRCRFMGCYDGFKPIKWTMSLYKRYYTDANDKKIYDSSDVSGYYCLNDTTKYDVIDNIGVVEKSSTNKKLSKVVAPLFSASHGRYIANPLTTCTYSGKPGYYTTYSEQYTPDSCTTFEGQIGVDNPNIVGDDFISPKSLLFKCALVTTQPDLAHCNYLARYYDRMADKSGIEYCADVIDTAAAANPKVTWLVSDVDLYDKCDTWTAFASPEKMSPQPFTSFNCAGEVDSMIVGDSQCLRHLKSKRDSLGECYIPNGKGIYDREKARCRVNSCRDGFEPSISGLACVDTKRICSGKFGYGNLGQIQIGFLTEPQSVCMASASSMKLFYSPNSQDVLSSLALDYGGVAYYENIISKTASPNFFTSALNTIKTSPIGPLGGSCFITKNVGTGSSQSTISVRGRYQFNYTGQGISCVEDGNDSYENTNFVISDLMLKTNRIKNSDDFIRLKDSATSTNPYYYTDSLNVVTTFSSLSNEKSLLNALTSPNNIFIKSGYQGVRSTFTYNSDQGYYGFKDYMGCDYQGQFVVKDSWGDLKCTSSAGSDDTVLQKLTPILACELQVMTPKATKPTIAARGYITSRNCEITSCDFKDPFYPANSSIKAQAFFKSFIQRTDYSGKLLNSYASGCQASPVVEQNILINNDYFLVRSASDPYLCDAYSLIDNKLVKSGVSCKFLGTSGYYTQYISGIVPDLDSYNTTIINLDEINKIKSEEGL